MIRRNLASTLRKLARLYPVVTITGPRQSGKTTLCQAVFPNKPYVSLEPADVREHATLDPRGFLREHERGAVLDEVQHAPDLLGYLQAEVDARPQPGRFVLTGSQHFTLSAKVSQSLAGRAAVLFLLPPSLDELRRFKRHPTTLLDTLWMGAFPRIHDRGIPAGRWLADYVTTYLERDVRQVTNVGDLQAFHTFLRLCAGRTGQVLNLSSLGADCGITHNTARAWLSVLETSFIVTRLPVWHRNLKKQMTKAPKLHMLDTGLCCQLLGIREPSELRHHPLRGALFESWVVTEALKARLHRGLTQDAFYFRDHKGLEIDLIVDSGAVTYLAEVKSGETVTTAFFEPLERVEQLIVSGHVPTRIEKLLVYGGDAAQRRSNVRVVPWSKVDGVEW